MNPPMEITTNTKSVMVTSGVVLLTRKMSRRREVTTVKMLVLT